MKNTKRLLFSLSFTLLLGLFQTMGQGNKPNILFILTDDHRADAISAAGNPIIHTPHMDELLRQGWHFKNAFASTPICAASRASILTGLYERTHRYTFQQGNLNPKFAAESYPLALKKAGYFTGFYGKFGVEYPAFKALFDQAEQYDRNTKYPDRRGYFYKTLGKDTVHLTRYTGQKAIEFIAEAPIDQPFCLSLSFSAPHAHDPAPGQYFWDKSYDTLYQNANIPAAPMSSEADFLAQPPYVRQGENHTRWAWRFDTPEHYQESVKGYYRMITEVDAEIGKIREALKAKGLDKNTIIILLGDNGYFLGERQLADKWLMYDLSLRVPLIIFDPRTKGGKIIEDQVLNLDIAPTLLGYAGLKAPHTWQGQDLSGHTQGKTKPKARRAFVCEHLWKVNIIASSEGFRTPKWKYFRYRDDPKHEELYRLDQDPMEAKNLAKDASYQRILKRLRTKMEKQIQTLEAAR